MTDIDLSYEVFWADLMRDAESSGEPQQACFFQVYSECAAENGDCSDLLYTPVRRENALPYQADGYAIDQERGELHLVVCDFRARPYLETLNQAEIDSLFRRAERFVDYALKGTLLDQLEETSPEFEASYPIHENASLIARVRLIIFSNARLTARKKTVESKQVGQRTFTYNLLDFTRFNDIVESRGAGEPIEIRLEELDARPLPCIKAHTEGSDYQAYLVVLPGEVLAEIYGRYGPRLLEQNVRTFLQARTKVNRGLIETVINAPEMFFAYNNGLTATAAGVSLCVLPDGTQAIEEIRNLQIVNGGQTTASILYARDRNKANLSRLFVQMKLSVVDAAQIDEIVPKISRYANTQNRISEADFFSGHPFHVEMEKISRRLSTPQKPGALSSDKWFYERARGQYRDRSARGTSADQRKFKSEFPAEQVVGKTDLAKYEIAFEMQPHVVCLGAQKCFMKFAEEVSKRWEVKSDQFNEAYFKEAMGRALVFRWTDSMIAKSDWYQADRGYKAQTVAYTISLMMDKVTGKGKHFDFLRIWNSQEVPDGMKRTLELLAPLVARDIRKAPETVKNIGEYCKRPACWASIQKIDVDLPPAIVDSLVSSDERRRQQRDAAATQAIDSKIDFDVFLFALLGKVDGIREFADRQRLLSPKSSSALSKLASGNFSLAGGEKNALKALFERMQELGFNFPQPPSL
jgi:hypothetical protein